jgi:hypothetical protein
MSEYAPEPVYDNTVTITTAPDASADEREALIDQAWEERSAATTRLGEAILARTASLIREHLPAAHTLVLKEDMSHLPAHGHVEDITDANGTSIMPALDEWHDLTWTMNVDDDVWEIHQLWSLRFVSEPDRVRRLHITFL